MTDLAITDRCRRFTTRRRAKPAHKEVGPPADILTTAVVEMLLKDQDRLNALTRDAECQRDLVPRFMAVAIGGFTLWRRDDVHSERAAVEDEFLAAVLAARELE